MNSPIKRIFSFAVVAVASIGLLAACSKSGWTYNRSPQEQQVRQCELALLTSLGVQVFTQGESVKIILPDSALFEVYSANLRYSARFLLNHVARLVKTYTIVNLKVSAYSDSEGWPGAPYNQKLGLTNRQAEVVASYLWATGIDMRFITAKGYSETHPVAWNITPLGRSFNRRVEVTFQFYPHFVAYN